MYLEHVLSMLFCRKLLELAKPVVMVIYFPVIFLNELIYLCAPPPNKTHKKRKEKKITRPQYLIIIVMISRTGFDASFI